MMSKVKVIVLSAFVLFGFKNLKAQTLTNADKSELSELVCKWDLYTDNPNLESLNDYIMLWSNEDPVLTNPFGTFKGIDAIRKWQQGYNVPGGPAFGKRHAALNIVSKSTGGNEAEVNFDLYLSEVQEIPFLAATSRNKVKAVKRDGIWKIKSYTIVLDAGFMKAMEKMKKDK